MANETPTITEQILAERLHKAVTEDTLVSTGDYSDIPIKLGVADVDEVAADILFKAKIVNRDELATVRAILRAKQQKFKEQDYSRKQVEREIRGEDPQWVPPRQPTYYRFVGGNLLTNLNLVSHVAFEYAGSDVLDWSMLAVTNFLGHVISEQSGMVTKPNPVEVPIDLPDTGS